MQNVVATIPMNPAHASKVGFYSLFAFASELARLLHLPSVFALNLFGKDATEVSVSTLKNNLLELNIEPSFWWIDSDSASSFFQKTLSRLYAKGRIYFTERSIDRCACGQVEYFSDADLYSKKTLIEKGYSRCCHTAIVSRVERVLVASKLPLLNGIAVHPKWAQYEFVAKAKKISVHELLISRHASRQFQVTLDGETVSIDNDVIWWLYTKQLSLVGYRVSHLVVGASILQQAAMLSTMSALVELEPPDNIYVLPKVYFSPVANVDTIGRAIAQFGPQVIKNALIWSALSQRKSITLCGSAFPTISTTPLCGGSILVRSRDLLRRKG